MEDDISERGRCNILLRQNVLRPLEDDSSAVVSESKRLVLDPRGRMEAPHNSASVASQESAADLFVRESAPWPEAVFNKPQEPRSRKRKEMDEEIDVDELESLMSEEFYHEAPAEERQPVQAAATAFSLPQEKQEAPCVGDSSASKKQRVRLEGPRSGATPRGRGEKDSTPPTNSCRQNRQPLVSIKTEPVLSPESVAVQLQPSKPLRVESASSSPNIWPCKDKSNSSSFEVKHQISLVVNSFTITFSFLLFY